MGIVGGFVVVVSMFVLSVSGVIGMNDVNVNVICVRDLIVD